MSEVSANKDKGCSASQLELILGKVVREEAASEDVQKCYKIASATNNFVDSVCSPESKLLGKIEEKTNKDPKMSGRAIMLSGHVVGRLLKMMAEMTKAEKILEIGTFTGYSAVAMAESDYCTSLISLDVNEYSKKFVEEAIKGTAVENKINVRIASALESLAELAKEGKVFDLVFIDADKGNYLNYYKFILDHDMLKRNGVILCDNILWANDTILERKTEGGVALAEFVEFVKADERVEQIFFPYRDGVLMIKLRNL